MRAAGEVLLSTVAAGEPFHGFRCGNRFGRSRQELGEFIASPFVGVTPVTMVTADRFGRIAAGLKRRGAPTPTNDIWLVAQAMGTGAELVSFDGHDDSIDRRRRLESVRRAVLT